MWLQSGLRTLLLHCHSGLRAKQQKNPARVAASKTQKQPVTFFVLAAAAEPKATHYQITGLVEPCCSSLSSSKISSSKSMSNKSTSVSEQKHSQKLLVFGAASAT